MVQFSCILFITSKIWPAAHWKKLTGNEAQSHMYVIEAYHQRCAVITSQVTTAEAWSSFLSWKCVFHQKPWEKLQGAAGKVSWREWPWSDWCQTPAEAATSVMRLTAKIYWPFDYHICCKAAPLMSLITP